MKHRVLSTISPNYNYKPIAYHDSWISIDPIVGCQLDCKYCFLQMNNWTKIRPTSLYSVPEIADMLVANKYFIPHVSILCFGNCTDAFLDNNIDFTFSFLEEIKCRQLKNPLVFVTKKKIPIIFQDKIKQVEHNKVVFCVSYSGLAGDIERGVDIDEIKINFQNLHLNKLNVVHFWRPIIRQNGTLEKIKEILGFVSRYALASVYVGLKLHPNLAAIYKTRSLLAIPEELSNFYGDYIPPDIEELIISTAKANYQDYPIYKHTSCAISLALGIADYTATRYKKTICTKCTCPSFHRIICERAMGTPTKTKVSNLLSKIGIKPDFTLYSNLIEIHSEISQEDYTFLLHQINLPIVAKNISFNMLLHGSIFRKDNSQYVLSRNCQSSAPGKKRGTVTNFRML